VRGWSECRFYDTVKQISSLSFIRLEVHFGTWMHSSGAVESSSLTSDGSPVTSLILPQRLHDLGKFYVTNQQIYCHNAFSVVVHAFQNDISGLLVNDETAVVMPVDLGGSVARRQVLERQLEEAYRHILALKTMFHSISLGILAALA
jgi:hypothetical protein